MRMSDVQWYHFNLSLIILGEELRVFISEMVFKLQFNWGLHQRTLRTQRSLLYTFTRKPRIFCALTQFLKVRRKHVFFCKFQKVNINISIKNIMQTKCSRITSFSVDIRQLSINTCSVKGLQDLQDTVVNWIRFIEYRCELDKIYRIPL